jgi:hypothetical protein
VEWNFLARLILCSLLVLKPPCSECKSAPRKVPTTMATTDWFNDGPNSGLVGTMGGLPAWQIVDCHMKKLMMNGDFLSSSGDALNDLSFDAYLLI